MPVDADNYIRHLESGIWNPASGIRHLFMVSFGGTLPPPGIAWYLERLAEIVSSHIFSINFNGRCVIISKHIKVIRRLREFWMIGRGLARKNHPILAHIVPMRRCNLACTYCNEFDDYSAPVPENVMLERI